MRRAATGLLLVLSLLSAPAGAQTALERTPAFFVLRLKAPFDDVMLLLQEAIKRRNYAVTGVNDLDDALARRAADVAGPPLPYERYKVVGFCSLTLADVALRLTPYVGALMPCRAVVFRSPGKDETVVVAFRPSFLVPALGAGLERVMAQAEQDVLEILGEIAAD
jgi:uncharacterized protein (DUF302 family)